jgi:hypothetical protein
VFSTSCIPNPGDSGIGGGSPDLIPRATEPRVSESTFKVVMKYKYKDNSFTDLSDLYLVPNESNDPRTIYVGCGAELISDKTSYLL